MVLLQIWLSSEQPMLSSSNVQLGQNTRIKQTGEDTPPHMMVVETEEMNSSSSPRVCILSSLAIMAAPLLVSSTFSALFGRPSQDGVWLSGRCSTHCRNCSRLNDSGNKEEREE